VWALDYPVAESALLYAGCTLIANSRRRLISEYNRFIPSPEATVLDYFAKDWKGEPFQLFGTPHLIGIAIIVAINLFLIFGWKNPSLRAKLIFRYTLATILVVNETLWHLWN
jgi:hypothetical protein